MSLLQKRRPFAADEGVDPIDDDDHVMDEQGERQLGLPPMLQINATRTCVEQQETLDRLNSLAAEADQINVKALTFVFFVSIGLQVSFVFSALQNSHYYPNIPTPLASFFSAPPAPLIPGAVGFSLLAIILLAKDVVSFYIEPQTNFMNAGIPMLPDGVPTRLRTTGNLYFVAPVLAIVLSKDLPQILWWLLPGLTVSLIILAQYMMQQSGAELEELRGLKYDARGA